MSGLIINSYAFSSGDVFIPPEGFRAIAVGAQTLTGSTFDQLVFGDELFDTESAFASNEVIVPSSWNGKMIELTAASRTVFGAGNPTLIVTTIEVSTNSGSTWTTVAYAAEQNQRFQTAQYFALGSTGDYYRARFYCNDSRDTLGGATTLFAGGLLNA